MTPSRIRRPAHGCLHVERALHPKSPPFEKRSYQPPPPRFTSEQLLVWAPRQQTRHRISQVPQSTRTAIEGLPPNSSAVSSAWSSGGPPLQPRDGPALRNGGIEQSDKLPRTLVARGYTALHRLRRPIGCNRHGFKSAASIGWWFLEIDVLELGLVYDAWAHQVEAGIG